MPRKNRNIIPGSFYHLMMRGSQKRPIFEDGRDYEKFLSLALEAKEKTGFNIIHYTLMPNHGHFIIQPNTNSVSEFLIITKHKYARYYCKKYEKTGHVWQAHSKCILIDDDFYLAACGAYIEHNPVKAGLVERPEDWPYSSYRHYAGIEKDPLITDNPLYETLGKDAEERAKMYKKFFGS